MHSRDINVDSEWVIMWHWTVGFININTFNPITSIFKVTCNKFIYIRTVLFLNNRINSWQRTFVNSGGGLIGVGSERRLNFLFFSYYTNKASFRHFLWETFKPSPILFGVGGFFGRRTSMCETTYLTWSNMERIFSISVLWLLFLIHRLILTLYFPRVLWWR